MVIARAIVRDRAGALESAEIYSAMMVVMYLAPVGAPILGGQMVRFADWNAVFGLLVAFGGCCFLASVLWLKESLPEQTATLARRESPILSYWSMLREPRFLGFALCGAFSQGALMTYVVTSPDLFMNRYGFSAQSFGWMFALNGGALVLASNFNRLLLRRFAYNKILRVANGAAIASAACLTLAATGLIGGAWIVLPLLSIVVVHTGFIIANALAGAMSVDPRRAGSASALAGAGQFAGGAACTSLASLLHDGNAVPMAAVILGAHLAAGVALHMLARTS
jgi:DHA1 family bicyclomycin/chloramphenicol resistance-like MFS transporter